MIENNIDENIELKVLDDLLRTLLVSNSFKYSKIINETIDRCDFLKNVQTYIFESALLKLSKDCYVLETNIVINYPIQSHFNISFEGIVFIKNGGYEKQYQQTQQKEIEFYEMMNRQSALESKNTLFQAQLVVLTYLIAFGTLVAAIYYLLEVLAFLGVLQTQKA